MPLLPELCRQFTIGDHLSQRGGECIQVVRLMQQTVEAMDTAASGKGKLSHEQELRALRQATGTNTKLACVVGNSQNRMGMRILLVVGGPCWFESGSAAKVKKNAGDNLRYRLGMARGGWRPSQQHC